MFFLCVQCYEYTTFQWLKISFRRDIFKCYIMPIVQMLFTDSRSCQLLKNHYNVVLASYVAINDWLPYKVIFKFLVI